MISVIVYGRNDSYGYNLAKRAAISLNCIAQLLDDPDDEIIFVDCNSPNDIPTFPESIADTLTPKTRQLLRVLRLRPEQYERGKNGAKFKVLEPLCRNIAIRRSNPANRWILNTNTDMVFTPQRDGQSLTSIFRDLPDGFYELPRFEMPESLWESTDRFDPVGTIASFKNWGLRLHISEIIKASKETLFDGPGDFQLCLRNQLIQIHGMNEQMVLGWHVDSNLCKRMWLLNGETRTILNCLHAFHCDHTRIQTVYHLAGKSTENSFADFFVNVTTPYIPEQAESWGMPDEEIEEIKLNERQSVVSAILEQILPGMDSPIIGKTTVDGYDTGFYYSDYHVFPYLADIVVNFSKNVQIGYFGSNVRMLSMLSELRRLLGHTGWILYNADLLPLVSSIPNGRPVSTEDIHANAGAYIIDLSMKHLPVRPNESGLPIPDKCPQVVQFARKMSDVIIEVAGYEKNIADNGGLLRPAIFIGCHYSSFDTMITMLFSCAMTPASTHIRSGVLSPGAFNMPPPVMPLHFYAIGSGLQDKVSWISGRLNKSISEDQAQLADRLFTMFAKANEKQTALDAIETLLSFDAGRGMLEMQIEISKINGVPEQGEALRNFINEYEKRPYEK